MKTVALKIERRFNYNGMTIPDPNPKAPLEDVVKLLSATYPEFSNAKLDPVATTTEAESGSRIETFGIRVSAGSKG